MIQVIIVVFGMFGLLFSAYHALIAIVGTLKGAKKIPQAEPKHRIAAVIAARNEEEVIAKLIESLKAQEYPEELCDIFVIPNNCTDDTEAVARAAGAKILDCDVPVKSKGEVLSVAFRKLMAMEEYDAYCIFDADNLVDPGFFRAANNALCAGFQVAQGYRDSKNPDDSWISGCTSVFFWFMDRMYNQARFALNMSASLNGTGILVSAAALEKTGWHTETLTEDLEFTAQCALNGIRIGWMREAITYDEQPNTMKASFTQRRRWSAGTLQCFRRYYLPLLKRTYTHNSFSAFDISTIFSGPVIQLISIVPFPASCILIYRQIRLSPLQGLISTGQSALGMLAAIVVGAALFVLLICLLEKKMSVKRVKAMAMMVPYLLTWGIANFMCLVTKAPKWEEIPHGKRRNVSDYARV